LVPKQTQAYSIAMYAGATPWTIQPLRGARQPLLTRRHVTDVPAAFVADPFMLQRHGAWHLWFEVMRADRGLGEIGLATSPNGRDWTYRGIVLAEGFHLSYPYVFVCEDDVYMIPETGDASSVRLYRASTFPHAWVFVTELLTGATFLDASVFHHDGRWWMLVETSGGPVAGATRPRYATLRLYHAVDLHGPWTEHPMSPVVDLDPAIARPAGRVVKVNGRPVRFGQDCSIVYGQAVRAFAIEELSETQYRERLLTPAPFLGPGPRRWNRHGMHHIDAHQTDDGGWVACVDGWRWRRRDA